MYSINVTNLHYTTASACSLKEVLNVCLTKKKYKYSAELKVTKINTEKLTVSIQEI